MTYDNLMDAIQSKRIEYIEKYYSEPPKIAMNGRTIAGIIFIHKEYFGAATKLKYLMGMEIVETKTLNDFEFIIL